MKKIVTYCGLSILIGMAACTKGESNYTATYNMTPINIITSLEDGTTTASQGNYKFELTSNYDTQYGTIEVSDLVIDNNIVKFITDQQTYQTNLYYAYFQKVKSGSANISDANFLLTPYYNYPAFFGVPANYANDGNVVIASFNYGNSYKVTTFQKNTFYTGTTTTSFSFQGQSQQFDTETIYYQLDLNVKESPNTARLVMYNAKFTNIEQEPIKKQINIEGLTVEYSNGMIKVYGEDIIPDIVEGTSSTPYPNYVFNTIEFETTSSDLTNCKINYVVAGVYKGSFNGSYANTSGLSI